MLGSLRLRQEHRIATTSSNSRHATPHHFKARARAAAAFTAPRSTRDIPTSQQSGQVFISTSSSSSTSPRGSSCICRDAPPRPMWAAKTAPPAAAPASNSLLEAMITRNITACSSVQELEDIYNEWGGSFCVIAAAAAIAKYAKLRGAKANSPFLARLLSTWQSRLPDAGLRACANVLWALGRLGVAAPTAWDSTWEAYMQHIATELQLGNQCGSGVYSLRISHMLFGQVPRHASSQLWLICSCCCKRSCTPMC